MSPVLQTKPPRVWQPPLSERGAETINDRHRYLLCSGPKQCGKTFGLCNKVAKHLYDHDGARVAIVVKRKSSAALGVWTHLTQDIIEGQWQKYGRILPYVRRPGMESSTKSFMFSVRNAHGGTSYCYIFPLFNPKEVEEVFKNTSFSMVYVNEIDQFPSSVFRAIADQLRSTTVANEHRQFISDCNPPEDGIDHWLYPLFVDPPKDRDASYTAKFKVIYWTPDDNPFISDDQKLEIKNSYKGDPEKYKRYWLGEWIKSTSGSIYEGSFDPNVHVIGSGDATTPEEEWTVLTPPPGTYQLFTSWDLGATSHAVSLFSKRWASQELVFDVLDEVVSIDMEVSIDEVVKMTVEKMTMWEEFCRETLEKDQEIQWTHWADTSSFRYNAAADSTEAALVDQYSDGKISFRKIKKPKIDYRIELMKRLFSQNQVFFSIRCPAHIAAFRLLRKEGLYVGKKEGGISGKRLSSSQRKHTHPFDALTYGISHELPASLMDRARPSQGRIISVRQR